MAKFNWIPILSSEYNQIMDCMQNMKDYLINTVSQLQEAESKLYAASCKQDDVSQIQNLQNASREKDVCCSEGEATECVQAPSSPNQQSRRTSLNEMESQNLNQIQSRETKTVGKYVPSLAESISAQEQDISREPPMKKEDGEHRLLMKSVTEKKDCSEKDKPHGGSAVTEKSPEQAFQDALLISSSEGILSGALKDSYDETVTNLFEQEKTAVVEETSKGIENGQHRLTGQMEGSKTETNNEICRNDQITFTSSAQTCDLTAVNPSMSDSEIQKSRHWMDKE